MRPFLIANMVNLAIRLSVALIFAPRFGIAFVWLENFLISYVALKNLHFHKSGLYLTYKKREILEVVFSRFFLPYQVVVAI